MRIVPTNHFDTLVAEHSAACSVSECQPGVLRFRFGSAELPIAEDAARDFLYELTVFFAQKDLADYDDNASPQLADSLASLQTLSVLRGRTI